MPDYEQIIKKHFLINEHLKIHPVNQIPTVLAEKILNYYLLHRANELYAQNRKDHYSSLAKHIKPELLEDEDSQLLQKLNFRNKYIPTTVLNIFRQVKRK